MAELSSLTVIVAFIISISSILLCLNQFQIFLAMSLPNTCPIAVSKEEIFKRGKRIRGSKATTGIGNASVTHQVIINPAIAKTFAAFS